MKTARRNLLETLKGKKPLNAEEPLKNVRNILGSIGYIKGNPLTKTEITLTVDIIFYDRNTTLTILPAALPANLQTRIPVFLFGLTDFWGGFRRLQQFIPPSGGWILAQTQWIGSFPIGIFNVTGDVPLSVDFARTSRPGDLLIHYADPDPLSAVNACVRIHCENVAYGTFLNSFVSDVIILDRLRYITPAANPAQLDNAFTVAVQSLFGRTAADQLDPRMYTLSTDFQANLVDIPLSLPIDKSVMIGFNINFDCSQVSFILFVKKVEHLIGSVK